MSSSIKIQAYRCVWDGRWMQYHDHTDPLPDKWDDEPPDEVAALVLKTDADFEIDRLRAALEKIATYPKLRKDELGYKEARKIAWEALQVPNEPGNKPPRRAID